MSKDIIIAEVKVENKLNTNRTRHIVHGELLSGNAYVLKIIKINNDPGYYLIHFDKNGNELTDTYHSSIDEAIDQASFEYQVSKQDWQFH